MPPAPMGTVMATITEEGLYRLLTWLSPGFPVGAYAYSHGIEYAVESHLVVDLASLTHWAEAVLRHGAGRIDADLFRDAWRAASASDEVALAHIVERGNATRGSAETALESFAQGRAFVKVLLAAWPQARQSPLVLLQSDDMPPPYAVAIAVATAAAGVPLRSALTAYLGATGANLVSAGVRLIPLGQTAGQQALAQLAEVVRDAVAAALARCQEDFGSAAPLIDWASMNHESQYTRLFRS